MGQLNITIVQNEDLFRTLTFKDAAGAVVDISGYTFEGEIHAKNEGALEETLVFAITDGPNGVATMTLGRAETAGMDEGEYQYDVFVNDGTYNRRRLYGTLRVEARITGSS